jgi:hypothetical protein
MTTRCIPGAPLRRHALAALLVAGLAAGPAAAVIVSGTLDFSATNFAPGAPHPTVTGRVAYSFDNAAGFFNLPDGASANGAPVQVEILSSSLPGGWVPVLSYITLFNGQPADFFAIGHGPTTVVNAGTDDWRVAFDHTNGPPAFRELTYAVAAVGSATFMSFTGEVAAVPEPATWATLGLGTAVLGLAARRRRFTAR